MEKILSKIRNIFIEIISTALTFLCLGIVVELLISNDILGWSPVSNVKQSGEAFIGVTALLVLYILFLKKRN